MSQRLQEPSFLILSSLAGGAKHGYGIIKEVQELSAGAVSMKVGTLYGALDRLAAEHLIEVDREEIVDSRLRRYYRLSADGAVLLSTEATRINTQANVALRRLRVAGMHP
ncbi:PadR family transcriptional regulator [Nakamurella silvestris]|nr:PadR family transcriptional regulator [Nakamurella silvestris]